MCAKINLAKFSRNTTHLGLAKFFPGENFPLYGTYMYTRNRGIERYLGMERLIKYRLHSGQMFLHVWKTFLRNDFFSCEEVPLVQ